MDGRARRLTIEERREAAVDVLAQAVLGLALARLRSGCRAQDPAKIRGFKELATSAEQRLHVHESAGEGRRREEPQLVEVRP
jgi:hypothetical protein